MNNVMGLRPGRMMAVPAASASIINKEKPAIGLVIPDLTNFPVSLSPSALIEKERVLALASEITSVHSEETEASATEALKRVNAILKEFETSRKAGLLPLDKIYDNVKATSERFTADLKQTKDRISNAIANYIELKRAEVEELEAARLAEQAKLEEANRKAIEDADKAAKAAVNAKSAKARKAAEVALVEAQAKIQDNETAMRTSNPLKATQTSGLAFSKKWKAEVTDIQALFKARPDLINLEPSQARINTAVQLDQTIPGLRVWEESKAIARS